MRAGLQSTQWKHPLPRRPIRRQKIRCLGGGWRTFKACPAHVEASPCDSHSSPSLLSLSASWLPPLISPLSPPSGIIHFPILLSAPNCPGIFLFSSFATGSYSLAWFLLAWWICICIIWRPFSMVWWIFSVSSFVCVNRKRFVFDEFGWSIVMSLGSLSCVMPFLYVYFLIVALVSVLIKTVACAGSSCGFLYWVFVFLFLHVILLYFFFSFCHTFFEVSSIRLICDICCMVSSQNELVT